MATTYFDLILYAVSILGTYFVINWKYGDEFDIRFKWMQERLNNGKWKILLGIVFTMNLAILFTRLIFFIVPDDFILKPIFISSYSMFLFSVFFFKYFYEIIGGAREWKFIPKNSSKNKKRKT